MRLLAIFAAALILTGCDYGFTFHFEDMTPDQMLDRAELVFIGVVQEVHLDSWPFFRIAGTIPDGNRELWKPIRRRIRVETVLRGQHDGQYIDVYEIVWLGGTSGSSTPIRKNGRYLFLARKELGRWRSVRDGRFGMFAVKTGPHARLPLDNTRPLWERFTLSNYWANSDEIGYLGMFESMSDPGNTVGLWRATKLLRGLLRHPQHNVRLAACWELNWLSLQDECSRDVSEQDWAELANAGFNVQFVKAKLPAGNRDREQFDRFVSGLTGTSADRDSIDRLRLFTTINNPVLRREFCQEFLAKFPHDTDNGCSADNPFPATIVTENGDVPLVGLWPN